MNETSPVYILDSFAILAFLEDEHGATRVEAIIEQAEKDTLQAILSIINLGEILYITQRERGLPAAQKTLATIDQLPLKVLSANRKRVLAAAHIKANFPVAYADAFAIAAAQEFSGIVLTGDPEFSHVEAVINVEWLQ